MNYSLLQMRSMAAAGLCTCAFWLALPNRRAQTPREAFDELTSREPELLQAPVWDTPIEEHGAWISHVVRQVERWFLQLILER